MKTIETTKLMLGLQAVIKSDEQGKTFIEVYNPKDTWPDDPICKVAFLDDMYFFDSIDATVFLIRPYEDPSMIKAIRFKRNIYKTNTVKMFYEIPEFKFISEEHVMIDYYNPDLGKDMFGIMDMHGNMVLEIPKYKMLEKLI